MQEAAIEAQRTDLEMELHQKIVRETGNLSKAANTHGETLQNLVKYRLRAKEERRMLSDEKKVTIATDGGLECKIHKNYRTTGPRHVD